MEESIDNDDDGEKQTMEDDVHVMDEYGFAPVDHGWAWVIVLGKRKRKEFKASALSFKRFTSRLLKLSFSLYAHITSDECHAWFHLTAASPAARITEQVNITKNLVHGRIRSINTGLQITSLLFSPFDHNSLDMRYFIITPLSNVLRIYT